MPRNTDLRTRVGTDHGRMPTSGKRTVQYVDEKGRVVDATIIGQGSSSGLKLQVRNGAGQRQIDNVPLGTTVIQTACYFWAKPA